MTDGKHFWLSAAFRSAAVAVVLLLLGVRFLHLNADFPNHTYWADDHAKYSDEGWYGNAALNSVLLGHWYLPGDWAPAVVVPVWPALLTAEFHMTGVSVVAARATEVCFSILGLLMAAAIFKRYASWDSTLGFALLMAASISGYMFSRVAILERPFECAVLLCLWLAVTLHLRAGVARDAHALLLGVSLVLMVLTKTTGVFLLPAIFYPVWFYGRQNLRGMVRPLAIALATAAVLMACERYFFARHFAADAKAFFAHSQPVIKPFESARKAVRAVYRGTWIDPVLWPLACVALAASLWMRSLWRQLLWGVSFLWILGYMAFIVYHFDGPPRYFTAMTIPVFWLVAMFAAELYRRQSKALWPVLAICAMAVANNVWHVQRYVRKPDYSMQIACDRIRQIIDAHPENRRLIIGHAANQVTLFNGVPSMDDDFGSATAAQKMEMYDPGWVVIWGDETMADLEDITDVRQLVPMADLPALDDPVRDHLLLFKLEPLTAKPQQ